jgi:hypothetical protein
MARPEPLRERLTGLPGAALWLGVWFCVFFATLAFLVPGNVRGHTEPWGLGDVAAAILLVAGAYHAARYSRSMPLFFTYGVIGGLLYVQAHWPGANEFWDMPRGIGVLIWYGLYWFGVMIGIGILCRGAAKARWRALDASDARRADCCQNCGYLLYGLPEPRCPECGTPFERPSPNDGASDRPPAPPNS